jgi:excisionase family DNA binding protein
MVSSLASPAAGKRRSLSPERLYGGERLLTVGEVSSAMRVSNMTVYRLIKSGQLSALRVGKNYRIRQSDMEKYLADRSVKPNRNHNRTREI